MYKYKAKMNLIFSGMQFVRGSHHLAALRQPRANYNVLCEKERWENRVAVVTGAGSGIGRAIVQELVLHKIYIIGIDKRTDGLLKTKMSLAREHRAYFKPASCDVSNVDMVNTKFNSIINAYGGVDILVNSAGIKCPGQLSSINTDDVRSMLDTNVLGVVYCTQRAYQSMAERNSPGHIINICSSDGHYVPNAPANTVQESNIYTPTKHAIKAIAEVLRREINGLNIPIKITNISPGATATGMKSENTPEPVMKAKDVAAAVTYALFTPPHVNIHEVMLRHIDDEY